MFSEVSRMEISDDELDSDTDSDSLSSRVDLHSFPGELSPSLCMGKNCFSYTPLLPSRPTATNGPTSKSKRLNILQKLYSREVFGNFSPRLRTPNQRMFDTIPKRNRVRLLDVLPSYAFTQNHICMGLSKCGNFLLTYTMDVESLVCAQIYKYRLHWWLFIPFVRARKVAEVMLFANQEVRCELHISVSQWPTDYTRLLVYGYCTSNCIYRHSHVTMTTVPALNKCQDCLHVAASYEEDDLAAEWDSCVRLSCLTHGLTVHTHFEVVSPYPRFDPGVHMKRDGVVLFNTGNFLHILRADLTAGRKQPGHDDKVSDSLPTNIVNPLETLDHSDTASLLAEPASNRLGAYLETCTATSCGNLLTGLLDPVGGNKREEFWSGLGEPGSDAGSDKSSQSFRSAESGRADKSFHSTESGRADKSFQSTESGTADKSCQSFQLTQSGTADKSFQSTGSGTADQSTESGRVDKSTVEQTGHNASEPLDELLSVKCGCSSECEMRPPTSGNPQSVLIAQENSDVFEPSACLFRGDMRATRETGQLEVATNKEDVEDKCKEDVEDKCKEDVDDKCHEDVEDKCHEDVEDMHKEDKCQEDVENKCKEDVKDKEDVEDKCKEDVEGKFKEDKCQEDLEDKCPEDVKDKEDVEDKFKEDKCQEDVEDKCPEEEVLTDREKILRDFSDEVFLGVGGVKRGAKGGDKGGGKRARTSPLRLELPVPPPPATPSVSEADPFTLLLATAPCNPSCKARGGRGGPPPPPREEAAERVYEFTEDATPDSLQKLSSYRLRRLAEKKYEFCEEGEDAENIVPYRMHRGREPNSRMLGPLLIGSPGHDGEPDKAVLRPFNRICLLSPKQQAKKATLPAKPAREEAQPTNPAQASKFTSHYHRRYYEVDNELVSVITDIEDEDGQTGSPAYQLALPLEVHGSGYSQLQMISQCKAEKLMAPGAVVHQMSFDVERFCNDFASRLCERAGKRYSFCNDYDVEILDVCPHTGDVIVVAMMRIQILLSEGIQAHQQYQGGCTFVWNMDTGNHHPICMTPLTDVGPFKPGEDAPWGPAQKVVRKLRRTLSAIPARGAVRSISNELTFQEESFVCVLDTENLFKFEL